METPNFDLWSGTDPERRAYKFIEENLDTRKSKSGDYTYLPQRSCDDVAMERNISFLFSENREDEGENKKSKTSPDLIAEYKQDRRLIFVISLFARIPLQNIRQIMCNNQLRDAKLLQRQDYGSDSEAFYTSQEKILGLSQLIEGDFKLHITPQVLARGLKQKTSSLLETVELCMKQRSTTRSADSQAPLRSREPRSFLLSR